MHVRPRLGALDNGCGPEPAGARMTVCILECGCTHTFVRARSVRQCWTLSGQGAIVPYSVLALVVYGLGVPFMMAGAMCVRARAGGRCARARE